MKTLKVFLALFCLAFMVCPVWAQEPQPRCVLLAGLGSVELVEESGCLYCKYTPPAGFHFCDSTADWSCAEGLRYGCPCGASLVVYQVWPFGDPEHRCICPDSNQQSFGGFYIRAQMPGCWFDVGSLDRKDVWMHVQADPSGTVNVDFLPGGSIVRIWRIPDGASAVVEVSPGRRQEVFLRQ